MSEEIEINEEIKNKTYHKFVETEAIAKVKSNRRNREVEIVLSETHLSWNFIGTDWRIPKSKRFKTFTLDSINLDFRKGSKGFLGSTSSELLIIRSRREQWSIMFDQGQNDEFEQFTELFDITKGKNAKTTIDANEIHYQLVKRKAMEKERTKDYGAAIEMWEKLGAYDQVVRVRKFVARERESARDYGAAIEMWEGLGEIKEAARVRKLKAEEGSVKVAQSVVQGDQITKTEIKDSVISKSNVGAGGDDKFTRLEKLTEMKKEGLIDDDDYEKMKREIIG